SSPETRSSRRLRDSSTGCRPARLRSFSKAGRHRQEHHLVVRRRALGRPCVPVLAARPIGSELRLSFSGLRGLLGPCLDEVLPALPDPQREALEIALLRESPGAGSYERLAVSTAVLGALRSCPRWVRSCWLWTTSSGSTPSVRLPSNAVLT